MVMRLTPAAKAAMVQAYQCAARDHAGEIREEHLLEGVLADPDGKRLLGGPSSIEDLVSGVCSDLGARRRKAGLTAAEEAALATWQIDLEVVVQQIEDQLGAQALAPKAPRRPRRRGPVLSGEALRVLAGSERLASAAGDRSLGIEHLALALVSTPAPLADSLAQSGVSEAGVRSALAMRHRAGGPR